MLEPTGSVRRRLVKLSSESGIISVPTMLATGMLAANVATAIATVVLRYSSALRSNWSYSSCAASSRRLKARSTGPMKGTLRAPSGGSRQTAESIGSSVKLTNSDTSTAAVTVIPKEKKNLPMMPLMNAIGTNTATIENVVASTASPISSVPWRAAE